ncbi:MAG TPA: hippurate hydrolase [Firmicutes bacterium]|nr:hippurate hydrolase [Bacillota bacterium]
MLSNYHTHHNRCGHAKGTVEDYVKEAVNQGYDEIGMSCHVPYENFPEMLYRMKYSEMEAYLTDIKNAQRDYPMISVLTSFECEYFPHLLNYYKELEQKTDYLIVAQHKVEVDGQLADAFKFTKPQELEAYAKTLVEAFETKLFQIVAHPDVFGTMYPTWDATWEKISRQIIEGAIAHDVILELNANGFRRGKKKYADGVRYPYPLEKFWDLVANDYKEAKVMINADCHHPKLLNDEFVKLARNWASKRHLNVVTKL